MESATGINTTQKLWYILAGLAGLSLVILVHEAGHFIFAHIFNVPTPIFSLGFGPALLEIPYKETIFQLSLIPFGGYVEMNSEILAQQNYLPKMLIMFGGILFNIIF